MRRADRVLEYLEARVPKGQRNHALFVSACVACELNDESLLSEIAVKAMTVDGLSQAEVLKTIESARKRVGVSKDTFNAGFGGHVCHVSKLPDGTFVSGKHQNATDIYRVVNPATGPKAADVVAFRHVLVESDNEPIERQVVLISMLSQHVYAVTHSGNKSLHILVRVACENEKHYDETARVIYDFCERNGFSVDRACKNPNRLTREPDEIRTLDGGKKTTQKLLYVNENAVPWGQNREPELVITKAADLEPPRQTILIADTLMTGERMLVAGPAKAGKTLAMYTLAATSTTGGFWFGRWVTGGQKTLYMSLETSPAHAYRAREALKKIDVRLDDVDFVFCRSLSMSPSRLADWISARFVNDRYDLLIIDPLYMLIGGYENEQSVVAEYLKAIDEASEGKTLVICHHHRKQNGYGDPLEQASGTSFFGRWVDTGISITKHQRGECVSVNATCRSFPGWHQQFVLNYPEFMPFQEANINNMGNVF